jgi:hypothetical protein
VAGLEVDQRLEQRLDGPLVQDPAEVLRRRRGGVGDFGRAHGGLIDHHPARVEPPATEGAAMSVVTGNQPDGTPTWIDLGIPELERAMAF